MRMDGGYETFDDDDLDGVLVEDETGVEARAPEDVAFEFALSDAGPAAELAREAADRGYEVEMRAPDDGEGFYTVICSRAFATGPAEIARAGRELEALAEEFGCIAEDDDEERETA